jgi:hypothetical protein
VRRVAEREAVRLAKLRQASHANSRVAEDGARPAAERVAAAGSAVTLAKSLLVCGQRISVTVS